MHTNILAPRGVTWTHVRWHTAGESGSDEPPADDGPIVLHGGDGGSERVWGVCLGSTTQWVADGSGLWGGPELQDPRDEAHSRRPDKGRELARVA